jgi:hypothetical protein
VPFTACEIHQQPIRWELNPKTRVKTKRCPRCGVILATITLPKEENNNG